MENSETCPICSTDISAKMFCTFEAFHTSNPTCFTSFPLLSPISDISTETNGLSQREAFLVIAAQARTYENTFSVDMHLRTHLRLSFISVTIQNIIQTALENNHVHVGLWSNKSNL